MRIYITGASCAGATTLDQNLATLCGVRHVDVDDFFWMPTYPPFTTKRPASEHVSLIQQEFGDDDWVLTGSCMGWGDALITHVDLIVFVVTATPVRLDRLAAREKERFGNRIAPGGDMHGIHVAFREWASQYDNPNFSGRLFCCSTPSTGLSDFRSCFAARWTGPAFTQGKWSRSP